MLLSVFIFREVLYWIAFKREFVGLYLGREKNSECSGMIGEMKKRYK